METTLDYELVETYLGDLLRGSDNLDIHADHFFPVTLLDLLFHYSESERGTERDMAGHMVRRNFHGHDFDRWIDNLVAATQLTLADDDGTTCSVQLVDIDSMAFDSDSGVVTVTLPDETTYTLLGDDGCALIAPCLNDLAISMDISRMFDHAPVDEDSEPYLGFGTLAHIVRVVADKSGIDPAKADAANLSRRLFQHFKNEMLPLVPSLWNDMEHIMHYAHPTLSKK